MTNQITLQPIDFTDSLHCEAIAGLWTGACGPQFALSPKFVAYTTRPHPGATTEGRFAWGDNEPLGAVIASAPSAYPTPPAHLGKGDEAQAQPTEGWITALATLPESQGAGVASKLLDWAESWLREQGCTKALLGGNIRPFVPGLPQALETEGYFVKRGYKPQGSVWDMAANLAHYVQPDDLREVPGAVHPAQPGQEREIQAFLNREFPDRWARQFEHFVLEQGRASDYMVLWTERGIDGICQLTFEDSLRTVERFFPYQLPRPWGQFGSVGVSADQRGKGFGLAIIDAGLRRLHNNGVNGCVIDWTTLINLYAKFGFEKYHEYLSMSKELINTQSEHHQ